MISLLFSDEKVAVLGQDSVISLSRRLADEPGTLGLDRKDVGGSMAADIFCIVFGMASFIHL